MVRDPKRNEDRLPGTNKGVICDSVAGTLILFGIPQKVILNVQVHVKGQNKTTNYTEENVKSTAKVAQQM